MRRKEPASSLKASHHKKRVVSTFSDVLSIAVLRLCETHKLSYEAAAERCGISPRYYGSIARKEAAPTILVLEKLCNGFQLTPNDLLVSPVLQQQLHFRIPIPVTHVQIHPYGSGFTTHPICPRCGISLEREYQFYCDRCGQLLSWQDLSKAVIILPGRR